MNVLCNYGKVREDYKCQEEAISLWRCPPNELGIVKIVAVCDWHQNVMLEARAEGIEV